MKQTMKPSASFWNRTKNKVRTTCQKTACRVQTALFLSKAKLAKNRGSTSIEMAITILIAVVLGGLMLAGLYKLLDKTVLPTLSNRISNMFSYSGSH